MVVPITEIRGIGTRTAQILANHGIETVNALASATVERIAAVPGFSETRARKVKEQALALLKQKVPDKKRAPRRAKGSKSKPASAVLDGLVQVMDEAGKDVVEAVQDALEENKLAAKADHEALEEMVFAMDEASQDVAESLVGGDTKQITQAEDTPESEFTQEISETIVLSPAIPEAKRKKHKPDKRGKKKKGKKKKNKKKGKKK